MSKVECIKCGKWFKNHNSWRVHYYLDCSKSLSFSCTLCDHAVFKRKYTLKKHYIVKHQLMENKIKALLGIYST